MTRQLPNQATGGTIDQAKLLHLYQAGGGDIDAQLLEDVLESGGFVDEDGVNEQIDDRIPVNRRLPAGGSEDDLPVKQSDGSVVWEAPEGSGLTSVASDSTLTGSGTTASRLSVANPFTNIDENKLDNIEENAEVNIGVEFTSTLRTKLNEIDDDATDDQTGSEIVSAIDANLGNSDWQTGGDPFDIHDDVTDPATINDDDRIVFSDEGTSGDPMRYARAASVRMYMQQGIQSNQGGISQNDADARYVEQTGDDMTGPAWNNKG